MFAVVVASSAPLGFTFLSIGDWGLPEGSRRVAPVMSRYQPDFVLALGDNFYSTGVSTVEDSQFQEKFEHIFSHPNLRVPWYVCGGNHDYYSEKDVRAQIDYTSVSPHSRWRYPDYYHAQKHVAKDGTSVLVVSLDTWLLNGGDTAGGHGSKSDRAESEPADPKQLKWLAATLATSRADWKVVIGHFPIFSSSKAHGDTPRLVQTLLPVLKRGGVDLYLSGHDHVLQHIKKEGVQFFGSGAGALVDHDSIDPQYPGLQGYQDRDFGFMVHEGTREYLTTTFRTASGAPDGEAEYSHTLYRTGRRRRRKGLPQRKRHKRKRPPEQSLQQGVQELEEALPTVPPQKAAALPFAWGAPWGAPWGAVAGAPRLLAPWMAWDDSRMSRTQTGR